MEKEFRNKLNGNYSFFSNVLSNSVVSVGRLLGDCNKKNAWRAHNDNSTGGKYYVSSVVALKGKIRACHRSAMIFSNFNGVNGSLCLAGSVSLMCRC